MSDFHADLPNDQLHAPLDFEGANKGDQAWKNEREVWVWEPRLELPSVLNIVDNTATPPTEVDGDIYIIDNTGASHANWDGASANSWVRYNGADGLWNEIPAVEGMFVYDKTSKDNYKYNATAWVVVAGGGGGGEDLAATLVLGNTTSGNNIELTIDDLITARAGSPTDMYLSFTSPAAVDTITLETVTGVMLLKALGLTTIEGSDVTITTTGGAGSDLILNTAAGHQLKMKNIPQDDAKTKVFVWDGGASDQVFWRDVATIGGGGGIYGGDGDVTQDTKASTTRTTLNGLILEDTGVVAPSATNKTAQLHLKTKKNSTFYEVLNMTALSPSVSDTNVIRWTGDNATNNVYANIGVVYKNVTDGTESAELFFAGNDGTNGARILNASNGMKLNGKAQLVLGATTLAAFTAAAQIDLRSTEMGLRLNVLTTTQRDQGGTPIGDTPVSGLIIYNSVTGTPQFYNGSVWAEMGGGGADGNGVYDGNGTIPTTTVSTITDTFELSGGLVITEFGAGKSASVAAVTEPTTTDYDVETADLFTTTVDRNITLAFVNPPASGKSFGFGIIFTKDATGTARTITLPASVKTDVGSGIPQLVTNSQVMFCTFVTEDAGTTWYMNILSENFS